MIGAAKTGDRFVMGPTTPDALATLQEAPAGFSASQLRDAEDWLRRRWESLCRDGDATEVRLPSDPSPGRRFRVTVHQQGRVPTLVLDPVGDVAPVPSRQPTLPGLNGRAWTSVREPAPSSAGMVDRWEKAAKAADLTPELSAALDYAFRAARVAESSPEEFQLELLIGWLLLRGRQAEAGESVETAAFYGLAAMAAEKMRPATANRSPEPRGWPQRLLHRNGG